VDSALAGRRPDERLGGDRAVRCPIERTPNRDLTATTPRRMGRKLYARHLIFLDTGELGLELADSALGDGKLERLLCALTLSLPAVDVVLLEPVAARRLGHRERLGQLPPRPRQVEHRLRISGGYRVRID
jgi:hypothetical protein